MIPAESEAALDRAMRDFADVVLIQRFRGVSEDDLAAQLAELLTAFEPGDSIRTLAYQKLQTHIRERWAHVIVPETTMMH